MKPSKSKITDLASFYDKSRHFTSKSGLSPFVKSTQGPVFTKGLRLSQVLGLKSVLKLRLLSKLSFVFKPYSQSVTSLSPRLSNNHSDFLCHVTFLFCSNYTISNIYPSLNAFYLRKSVVLKWKTLLPHINFQRLL